MEKKFRLLLLLALLMTAATGAWAQEQWDVVWDFTAWSTETVTALKADAAASKLEGWSDVEKQADAEADADPTEAAKDNCFWFAGTVNEDGSLSANGAVIKELKGLKFNSDYAAKRSLAIAVNYPSTSLGDYAGGAYLWLGGGGSKQTFPCFTIPGVKAGSKITIEVESYNTSSARGIGLYKNSYAAENLIGEQFTPKTFEAKTWDITEDCDVVVWNTSGCHIYTIKVKAPAAAPSSGYTVSMKDDVKDADKWTVKVGEGQAQALPIGGLKGDGSETVTLQYNGRLKVKGVKATSDAAPAANPNAYMKWDNTKKELVEAEIPAGATTVTNADTNVEWAAGTYVVEGDVEINGIITLNGDVDLIIKDGAKLTANQIVGYDKNLSIYGQANQTGQLVVNCLDNDAINSITTLEVHSAKVTAGSSSDYFGGFYNISTFNVYGGLVDAKGTAVNCFGIGLKEGGSMNIYGGEVKAEGKGNSDSYTSGIMCENLDNKATVTVYGGKLWAGNAVKKAFSFVNLQKGAGFTGKIETSADNSAWTEYTDAATPETKYVRVGY